MSIKHCARCNRNFGGAKCPKCGSPGEVSAVPDTIESDVLVQQASVPDLATLFKRGKKAGVIGSVSVYGEGAPS